MDLDSAPSAVAVPHTFTLRNRSTVAAQTSVRHDSRIALRQLLCRTLCAPPPSSLPRLPPPFSFYQPNPMLQTMRAVNSMALGFRPLPPPFSLLSLPPPPSLLLLPAKPYARPYARCEFDGSGLCWRSRPFVPPPSVLPPSSCPLPAPLSLFYLKQAPMRSLCRPMRAPYARDTILIGFRSCTLLRNHSCA